jgi:hypothetical protein
MNLAPTSPVLAEAARVARGLDYTTRHLPRPSRNRRSEALTAGSEVVGRLFRVSYRGRARITRDGGRPPKTGGGTNCVIHAPGPSRQAISSVQTTSAHFSAIPPLVRFLAGAGSTNPLVPVRKLAEPRVPTICQLPFKPLCPRD